MTAVVNWNGRDLPEDFRRLPPGTYVVETADASRLLSAEEEADLEQALDEADAEKGIPLADAWKTIEETLKR